MRPSPDQTPPFVPQIRLYQNWLAEQRGLQFDNYEALWRWSVTDLRGFWGAIWQYFDIESPTPYETELVDARLPGGVWFPGARVNYARQALRHGQRAHAAGHPAIRQRRSGQMPFQTLVASGGTSGLSESPSRFFNSLSSCWRC